MGAVWVARHRITRESVALKLMYTDGPRQDELHERLLREAAAPAQIGHAGLVRVLDAGVDPEDGTLYIAMELLSGESLRDRLARPGTTRATALGLVVEMLDPLAAAHARGFVHRDLKPQNAFVERLPDGRERVKLLDFGLSRRPGVNTVTDAGNVMGTVAYVAPEQLRDARNVGPAADVWSVGVMLYQILAGRLPFEGTAAVLFGRILGEPPPALGALVPDADPRLVALITRCLAKVPAERPADAGALHGELVATLTPRPAAPSPSSTDVLESAPTAVTPALKTPEPAILPPSLDSAITERRPSRDRGLGVRVGAIAAAAGIGALLALLVAWVARDDPPPATTAVAPASMLPPLTPVTRPPPAQVARAAPSDPRPAPTPSELETPERTSPSEEPRESAPSQRAQEFARAQQEQQQHQQQASPPSGANPRDCGRITNATNARCFIAATGGNASGEYMLRNLILAHTLIGDRMRARQLARRYFAEYDGSPFAAPIRQLGYSP
jgi:serine/threonine-protein kinase